jgi:outer membrane receptor protein involved in Fe transport
MCLTLLQATYAQKSVSGTVTDAQTHEALAGAIVTAQGMHSIVNNKGAFTIDLTDTLNTITVSCTGYQTTQFKVSDASLHLVLQPSASGLNEVVVSANREKQLRTEAPVAISVISKATIDETKATQLDQLLNKSAGVYMVDLSNQQHAMAIRQPLGYNNYFLYMEDGIPIRTSGDFNHNALIEINDASLERIEIVKGPASSLYGSQAVGGAVNFITQAPSLDPYAKIELEGGSFGYKRANIAASTTINKLGIYIGGYYANRNVATNQYNDFHKLALNFRADYTFNDRTKLTLTSAAIDYYTDQKGGLDSAHFYDKDYVNNPVSNQRFTYRKVKAYRTRATLEHSWNDNSHTSFTAYYRNNLIGQNPFYYESYPVNGKSTGQINADKFQSYGAIVQHVQQFNWLQAKWITGASFDVSPERYNAKMINIDVTDDGIYNNYTPTDSSLVQYKANLYNSAIYTQFEFTPINKLKVVAGVRYDRLDYKFVNGLNPSASTGPADTTNHYAHVTPKLGLTYNFDRNKGLYANYSLGFAPPDITTLYTGYQVPDLKPATFYNYEIGGWLNLFNKGFAEFSVYQLDGTNEIVSVIQPSGISLSQNTGRTRHRGVELSVQYNPIQDVSLRFGGTIVDHKYLEFTDGATTVDDKKMANAPPYIGNAQITYKPSYIKGLNVSVEWQGLASYYTDPENLHKYSGYNTFNLRAGYKYKNFELWGNCLNATNKVFATIVTYGYGKNTYYPGMLRTFNVGIGYTFSKKHQS